MRLAYLFGGQGTEAPQMGLDLAARVPEAAALLRHAGKVAGVDPVRVLSTGGPEFRRTSVVQPLLVAVGLGACVALAREGIEPSLVAGHSLGELAAWAAAGAIGFEDAIELAGLRGRLMEREAARHPGGMLGLTACDEARLTEAIALGQRHGSVAVAAHNAPEAWTVSGVEPALAAIAAGHRATRLAVSGAWHSPAMAGAVDELCAAVRGLRTAPARARWIPNRTGAISGPNDDVAELLAGQLVRPVQWARTIQTLIAERVTHVVALGPSKLMRHLVQENAGREVRVVVVENHADLSRAVAELREGTC